MKSVLSEFFIIANDPIASISEKVSMRIVLILIFWSLGDSTWYFNGFLPIHMKI